MSVWVIRFGDKEWRESDLTLGMAVQFQELAEKPWRGGEAGAWPPALPIASPVDLVSLLAVFIAGGDPAKLDDALAQASALNMAEALEMVEPDQPALAGAPDLVGVPPSEPTGGDPAGVREPRKPRTPRTPQAATAEV